jgi:hypothetical protein
MSKDSKPYVYYLIGRGWYGQLIEYCDSVMSKKGKDASSLYWKSYGLGMSNNISECIRQLNENFKSKRDMQYPVSLAMIYFHKRAQNIDRDAIQALNSDLRAAEEVTVG